MPLGCCRYQLPVTVEQSAFALGVDVGVYCSDLDDMYARLLR